MNIQQAKEELIHTIQVYTAKNEAGQYKIPAVHQRPLLLIGPPGIGKTAIVRQAADECGVALVAYTMTHHTRQSAVGLPVVENRSWLGKDFTVTEYTMSEIVASVYACMEETGKKEGILFLDEINCVSDTLTPTMLQFLQNKTFGTHKIPDGWILAAAGNPPEYNRSARRFDVVTLDRVKTIPVESDFNVWKNYASSRGVHSAVLAFLSARPGNFFYIEDTRGEREFVTARGWEDLSVLMLAYEENDIPVTREIIAEYLHSEKIAADFAAFYNMFRGCGRDYRPREILTGSLTPEEQARQAVLLSTGPREERYSVLQMLLSALFDEIRRHVGNDGFFRRKGELLGQFREFAAREAGTGDGLALMDEFLRRQEHSLAVRKEHRVIAEEEARREELVLRSLTDFRFRAAAERLTAPEALTDTLQSGFDEERSAFRREADGISAMVSAGFRFLEEAKTDREAMSFFMTMLTVNPDAAAFLAACPNGEYEKHLSLLDIPNEEELLKQQILQGKE